MGEHTPADFSAALYTKQGRLGPPAVPGLYQFFPRETWAAEIDMVGSLPVAGIEWMYDRHGEGANPLETANGRREMAQRLAAARLAVKSVCADYFMDCPLIRCTAAERRARLERLKWLIGVCPEVGIDRIVLPLLDNAAIHDEAEYETTVSGLRQVLPLAEIHGVRLSLETDLAPPRVRQLLQDIDHPMVGVNYDTGNSAAAGFDPTEEFAAYGQWIVSVHLKDRMRGGGTVPLGEGDGDFPRIREALLKIGYQGDFVMEIARGPAGEERAWQEKMALRARRWLQTGEF